MSDGSTWVSVQMGSLRSGIGERPAVRRTARCPNNSFVPVSVPKTSAVETRLSVSVLDLLSEMTCGSGCQESGNNGGAAAPNFLT